MGFDNSVIARESILLLINEGYYVVAGYEGDSINRENSLRTMVYLPK